MIIKDYGVIFEGEAEALAIASCQPLSFWGGVDAATGMIQDVHHDLCGELMTGKVLCIPYDRGSCSGSGIMFEMLRQRTNPAALLCVEAEAVLALGSVISSQIYQRAMPIRTISKDLLQTIKTGDQIAFTKDAIIIKTTIGR